MNRAPIERSKIVEMPSNEFVIRMMLLSELQRKELRTLLYRIDGVVRVSHHEPNHIREEFTIQFSGVWQRPVYDIIREVEDAVVNFQEEVLMTLPT